MGTARIGTTKDGTTRRGDYWGGVYWRLVNGRESVGRGWLRSHRGDPPPLVWVRVYGGRLGTGGGGRQMVAVKETDGDGAMIKGIYGGRREGRRWKRRKDDGGDENG